MTRTVGGVICGYCSIGRPQERDDAQQHRDDRDDVGEDRPLDEELREHRGVYAPGFGWSRRQVSRHSCSAGWQRALRVAWSAVRRRRLRIDGDAGAGALDAVDDHPVGRLDAFFDDAQRSVRDAELDRAILDDVLVVHHQHEFAALVGADRAVFDEQLRHRLRRSRRGCGRTGRGSIALSGLGKMPRRIVVPVLGIDAELAEIEPAFVRESRFRWPGRGRSSAASRWGRAARACGASP